MYHTFRVAFAIARLLVLISRAILHRNTELAPTKVQPLQQVKQLQVQGIIMVVTCVLSVSHCATHLILVRN